MSDFQMPAVHSFPPFFTLQPVVATREKQVRLWCDLILRWHQSRKEYSFAWKEWELWENKEIARKIDQSSALQIAEELVRSGHAEWQEASKSRLTLLWDRPADVAARIYDWAKQNDMIGKVATVYELYQGEDIQETDFFGMDESIIRKALGILCDEDRAVLFRGESSDEDGVKFL